MYAQALDANTINVLANIWTARYDALVSVTQDSVVTAWREMSACHAAACAALERELGERHGLGISDFEVLERLAESDGRKFRAQDLAAELLEHPLGRRERPCHPSHSLADCVQT